MWLVIWVLVAVVLLSFSLFTDKPLSQFLVEFQELEQKQTELENLVAVRGVNQERLNDALYAMAFSLEVLQEFKKQPEASPEQMCERLLASWVESRETIFDFHQSKNLWNFAVYRCEGNGENKVLKKLWRRHHEKLDAQNRNWKPGEGHIGRCFVEQIPILSPDTNEQNASLQVLNQSRPVHNGRQEDESYYNSFITSFIMVNDLPFGVLVLTSSELCHFQRDDHMLIAQTLGRLLQLGFELCQQGGRNGRKRSNSTSAPRA